MKTLNTKGLTLALVLAQIGVPFSTSFAMENFSRHGNDESPAVSSRGIDDAAATFTSQDLRKLDQRTDLDYLKLTPEQVQQRSQSLADLYEYYQTATVGRFAQVLEGMGMNVYQYGNDDCNFSDKAGTMACFVKYYLNYNVDKSPMANSGASGRGIVATTKPVKLFWKYVSGDRVVSYPGSVEPGYVGCPVSDSDDSPWDASQISLPFIIGNEAVSATAPYEVKKLFHFGCDYSDVEEETTTSNAVFSSENILIQEAPVIDNLVAAMKRLQLKALDGTVVFLSGDSVIRTDHHDARSPYSVVYPPFSRVAPVPQPIIYVAATATTEDLVQMLEQNAPKIYAYNQLFNAQLLPEISEVTATLRTYPEMSAEIAKDLKRDIGEVDQANLNEAMYQALLSLRFKANGIAAFTAAMIRSGFSGLMSNPNLRPIYVHEVVRQYNMITQNNIQQNVIVNNNQW